MIFNIFMIYLFYEISHMRILFLNNTFFFQFQMPSKEELDNQDEMNLDEMDPYFMNENSHPSFTNEDANQVQEKNVKIQSLYVSNENRKRKREKDNMDGYNVPPPISELHELSPDAFNKKDNEFDLFGKSIALQLNDMPIDQALRLQLLIQQAVTSFRLSNCVVSSPISIPQSASVLSNLFQDHINSRAAIPTSQSSIFQNIDNTRTVTPSSQNSIFQNNESDDIKTENNVDNN